MPARFSYESLRLISKQVHPTGGGTYTTAQFFVYDAATGDGVDSTSPPLSKGGPGGVGSTISLVFNASGTLTDRILTGPSSQPFADETASTNTTSWLLPAKS